MLTTLIAATTVLSSAQTGGPNDMDFWVGNWTCTGKSRNAPGKNEWTDTKCSNIIKKTLNGKVIEENFSMPGFTGRSWSVWSPAQKKWRQTWVDDTGAYLLLAGGKEGDNVVLNQTNVKPGNDMRMVFSQIKKTSFVWSWQHSVDGGKTWEDMWVLNYKRK